MSARSFRLALAGVLLLAAALRLWGLRWGLPDATHLFSYHPDEFHSLRGILSLALYGDPDPHFFNYGSLYLYLVSATCLLIHGGLVSSLDLSPLGMSRLPEAIRVFTLDARIVSALAGIATVYVVYLIGARIASRAAGLVAALALAMMPLHVLNCHYGTVDVTQALFIALCAYFSVRIVQGEGLRAFIWAGAMAGLAASVKYNGILALVMPGVAWVVDAGRRGRIRGRHEAPADVSGPGSGDAGRGPDTSLDAAPQRALVFGPSGTAPLLCLLAALVAFAVTSPYTFLAWSEAKKDILFELAHMRNGEAEALAVWPNGWLFHLRLQVYALPLVLLASSEAVRRRLVPAFAFSTVWYVLISTARVRYARYGVPLEAMGAVAVGVFWESVQWLRLEKTAAWVVVPLLCALWLGETACQDFALCRPLPQDVVLQEVLQRVPPGETVGMTGEPWFDMPPVDYCNGGAALRSNPLWARFKRPLREIAVTGMDVAKLASARPYAFLTGDTERLALKAGEPAALQMKDFLDANYTCVSVTRAPWVPISGGDGPPASDVRYACPTISLYLLRPTQ